MLISRIQQTLQSLWIRLPYDIRQALTNAHAFVQLSFRRVADKRITLNREIPFVPLCAKPIQPPQHANYHKVQAFPFPNTTPNEKQCFLFYDIFARNNELFIIFTEDDRFALAIRSEDIRIAVAQDKSLTLKEVALGQNNTYILTYAFDYPFTEHQVRVSCKGISKDFVISHVRLKRTGLLLHSTLFKDDYFLLPMFYDYYTKQGVDSFVWYYNGVLDQTLRHKYAFGDNVIILDWAYPYTKPSGHTGQFTQQLHALYKYGKPSYEYIGFFDLDEYIKTEHANLRSYILQNPGYLSYTFLNCWSWVFRLRDPSTKRWQHLPRILLKAKAPISEIEAHFVKNADDSIEKYQRVKRSKGIYKTSVKRAILHCFPLSDPDDMTKISLVKSSSMLLHIVNLTEHHSFQVRYEVSD